MRTRVDRRTVNLSAYPDLVVIYLGMRVNRITGIKTLLGFGPKISSSVEAEPAGLLRHETMIYSLYPMHLGMRQYWRDPDSLLAKTLDLKDQVVAATRHAVSAIGDVFTSVGEHITGTAPTTHQFSSDS